MSLTVPKLTSEPTPFLLNPEGNQSQGQGQKRPKKSSARQHKRQRQLKHELPEPCSPEDVLWHDVVDLLGQEAVDAAALNGTDWDSPFGFREEVELEVVSLSSNGTSLAVSPSVPWAVSTPFALPGETILARVYRSSRLHSHADLVRIVKPNLKLRDMSRVGCRYFGECAGCQYQMLSYETQLDLKRTVIVKAYQHFSDLPSTSLPSIGPTIPSPLQYGYRTKITPHFEAPPKGVKGKLTDGDASRRPDWLKIGFNKIGGRQVMDIEECPIATLVLNEALGPMREDIIRNIYTYKRGVSLLLRDSLEILPPSTTQTAPNPTASTDTELPSSTPETEKHICITSHTAMIRDRVGDILFEYPGSSFFQNNNSVLPSLVSYIRSALFPPTSPGLPPLIPTHLVDAYCGCGLFSLTLSPHFEHVTGIELSAASVSSARTNASLNSIPSSQVDFHSGDASSIFGSVTHYPRERTALIIDPPRKGCDAGFLEQVVKWRCAWVVYVSCNVHTQARDIGVLMRRTQEEAEKEPEGERRGRYVLESLRGVDLFPQTAHVESVAVLKLG